MLRSNNSVATLTMGSRLSAKRKGPWGRKCVYVWNTLSQMGESASMKPNDSQVDFGSYTHVRVVNVQSLGWKVNKHQIEPPRHH
jgi:hypothetical protein